MNSTPRPSVSKPSDPLVARVAAVLARDLAPSSDFDLNADRPRLTSDRQAAVLLPLMPRGETFHLVLTKRSAHLRAHPGQIALPGGRLDPGETHLQAALRESHEEIGLDPAGVEILGTLPGHSTVTGFEVTPFVGIIPADTSLDAMTAEVAEVFTVPLAQVLDPASFRIEGRVWNGLQRRYFTVPVGPWYIWGATARILKQLADGVAR